MVKVNLISQISDLKNHIFESNCNNIFSLRNFDIHKFLNINNIPYKIIEKETIGYYEKEDIYKELNLINTNDATIFLGKDENLEVLSLYYAYATKKKMLVFDDFNSYIKRHDEIAERFDSLTIITNIENGFELQSFIAQLNKILRIGILVGRDYKNLLYIINKNIIAPYSSSEKAILINRTDKISEYIEGIDKDYTYIPYKRATKSILGDLLGKSAKSLSIIGHGRDELLWITKGIICGGIKECIGGHKTSCVQNGQCFKNAVDILNISEIYALNLFVNACCSAKIVNTLFGENINIMHNFLGGYAATYIGTPFLANGSEALNYYYTALLLSNKKLGEINQLINIFYDEYGIGIKNSYYLFGDPTIQYGHESKLQQIKIELVGEGMDKFYLNNETYLVELCVNGNLKEDFLNFKKEVIIKNDYKENIYCHMFYDVKTEKTTLHLYSRGKLPKGKYEIRINKTKMIDINSLYKFNYYFELGICEAKLKRYYIESINSLNNYSSVCRLNMTRLDNITNAVYVKRKKIEERIEVVSCEIVSSMQNKIHSKGIAFDELCLASGFRNLSRNLLEKNCPYCWGKTYENIIISDVLKEKRKHIYCCRCGNIMDFPVDNVVTITFTGDDTYLEKKKEQSVTLQIENSTENSIDGYISIAIVNGVKEKFYYFPENQKVNLNAYEKKSIYFKMKHEEEVVCHNYWLMGIGVFGSELHLIKRDIFYIKGELNEK